MPLHPRIDRDVNRVPSEQIHALAKLGVATVHEANARTGLMHGIKPATGGVAVAGTAITCLNFAGDNMMIHAALAVCEAGDVMVVAVTSPSTHGMFGDMLATSCRARGVAAVVIDAAVRDISTIREMRFPVWARETSAQGTIKVSPGWVNIAVSCGGTVVTPGDCVVADDDGVVVVDRADIAEVIERGLQREADEAAVRPRLAAGELSLDISDLRGKLPGAGQESSS